MSSRDLWLQLLLGWLPIWALYALLILAAHPSSSVPTALLSSVCAIVPAALLGTCVRRLARRRPWPRPFALSFVAMHSGAAALYALAWLAATSALTAIPALLFGPSHRIQMGGGSIAFLVIGVWMYVMVAGVSYTSDASERAARAEATAARTQLAALRAQLHPHFLFNALHTVVQLIPRDPARAAEAAEQIGGLLRVAIEEERDLVPLGEEWDFVARYLDLERLRFGERLVVEADVPSDARAILVPSFAIQTLVENAVRHGAAPRVEATVISVKATVDDRALVVCVRDGGVGASDVALAGGVRSGTGLSRLRERLAVLYGAAAQLHVTGGAGGVTATLVVPRTHAPEAES